MELSCEKKICGGTAFCYPTYASNIFVLRGMIKYFSGADLINISFNDINVNVLETF